MSKNQKKKPYVKDKYNPKPEDMIREGTRGGRAHFNWEDVKSDKHRFNYVGHSLHANIGRWQKNRDVFWYTKDNELESSTMTGEEQRKQELLAIKQKEQDYLDMALGRKPRVNPNAPDLYQGPGMSEPGSMGPSAAAAAIVAAVPLPPGAIVAPHPDEPSASTSASQDKDKKKKKHHHHKKHRSSRHRSSSPDSSGGDRSRSRERRRERSKSKDGRRDRSKSRDGRRDRSKSRDRYRDRTDSRDRHRDTGDTYRDTRERRRDRSASPPRRERSLDRKRTRRE